MSCSNQKAPRAVSWIRTLLALSALGSILVCFGCYPTLKQEVQSPEKALKPVRFFLPSFRDDLDLSSLEQAIRLNLEYLDRLPPDRVFRYGPDEFTCSQVRESQKKFLRLIAKGLDPETLKKRIKKEFRVYKAVGRAGNRHVLFTGYFEPIYEGSLEPDETFRYPLYRPPPDLLTIDLGLFRKAYQGIRLMARIEDGRILPYYTRKEIEEEGVLSGKGLELAWLKDPVEVAFLQIQGSGRLKLKQGGSLCVGYAAKNGHPFRSIGRYLVERGFLKREELSMQRIQEFLASHPELRDEVLNHNPSYVFFRSLGQGSVVGNINVPLTPGRSLALDSRLFPKGALAFISTQKPVLDEKGKIRGWKPFSRFVLNQDTGGAIRGAGRADLFCGSGPYAEVVAGHLKHDGDLYILIGKP